MVGTRAAAWAPVGDLAAIVVIDEHDEAHQQEQAPTWHARDVALERARRSGVSCIMTGTATSWHETPAAGPLDGHVAGVPRRRLLLLVGLVVLVEDDHRGQAGHRRPGRGPGADHAWRPRAPAPSRAAGARPARRLGAAGSPQARAVASDGHSTSALPARRPPARRADVGRGRQPHDAATPPRRQPPTTLAGRRVPGGTLDWPGAGGRPRDRRLGRGGAAASAAVRPAHRHAAHRGQLDHVRRRAAAR